MDEDSMYLKRSVWGGSYTSSEAILLFVVFVEGILLTSTLPFEVYHNIIINNSQVLFVVAFQDNVEAGDGEGLVVGLVIFTFLAKEGINCFKGCLLLKYFKKTFKNKKSKETILKNLSGSSSTLIM